MTPQISASDAHIADLVRGIEPSHLRVHLSDNLSDATIARLRGISRVQRRMLMLCFPAMTIPKAEAVEPDVLGDHDPCQVAILSGAIWHARSLLKLVTGSQISTFAKRVGAGVQSVGLRHLTFSSDDATIETPLELAKAVENDGALCLSAWLQSCSGSERQRVLVRAPFGFLLPDCPPARSEKAKRIVSQVLSHLNREAQGANE